MYILSHGKQNRLSRTDPVHSLASPGSRRRQCKSLLAPENWPKPKSSNLSNCLTQSVTYSYLILAASRTVLYTFGHPRDPPDPPEPTIFSAVRHQTVQTVCKGGMCSVSPEPGEVFRHSYRRLRNAHLAFSEHCRRYAHGL